MVCFVFPFFVDKFRMTILNLKQAEEFDIFLTKKKKLKINLEQNS